MAADFSWLSYYAPVFAFFIVFIVIYVVLFKTEILGDNHWALLFVAFLVSTIFISAAGLKEYIINITPWFAVLVVSLVFLLALMAFIGKNVDFLRTGVGVIFVIALAAVFLISAYVVFSSQIRQYLPGGELYYPRVLGGILLLAVGAVVSWVLIKMK